MAFVTNNTTLVHNIRGVDIRPGETQQVNAPADAVEFVAWAHVGSISVSETDPRANAPAATPVYQAPPSSGFAVQPQQPGAPAVQQPPKTLSHG
jgi:hypothetical protein